MKNTFPSQLPGPQDEVVKCIFFFFLFSGQQIITTKYLVCNYLTRRRTENPYTGGVGTGKFWYCSFINDSSELIICRSTNQLMV